LCVAARATDYVRAAIAGWEGAGHCTAIGHARALDAAGAAFVNGTAAHGEDFDDTFEGGPVHAGAVIVPAVLAAAEREHLKGADALAGIAVGVELMCRASLVAPTRIHRAGFHPTAVFGALGAAAGVATARPLAPEHWVNALGIVGSAASGIIEYLAEGAWTKRLHPGWAAQAGIRAADLARAGFIGPRTVLEGTHGFYNAFAHTTDGDWARLTDGFGERWIANAIAFKPYACGTMTQPYVACARRLAQRVDIRDISEVICEAAEGTVHRLWEPLASKQTPRNGYAGKFSQPYCIAAGFIRGNVGLSDFSDEAVREPAVIALARKVRYRIDPGNPYPDNFTGHIRMTLRDGSVIEERQPHMRGGAHEPLSRQDIEDKFLLNARHGGYDAVRAQTALKLATNVFGGRIDLSALKG